MTQEERGQRDRDAASAWAKEALSRSDWALVNTQATDLCGLVCEIGAIAPSGDILFESLINPERPVSANARAVHGITDEMLKAAPTLPQVWDALQVALEGRTTLLAYNAEYVRARLRQSAMRYRLRGPSFYWQCIMQRYAEFRGNWSERHQSYTYAKLPGAVHRAIPDARAALRCLHEMAGDPIPPQKLL
jgi:DNA polymerase III subunit epsilon